MANSPDPGFAPNCPSRRTVRRRWYLLKLSGKSLTVQTRATERELRRSIGHHRSRQAEWRTCSTRTDADIAP